MSLRPTSDTSAGGWLGVDVSRLGPPGFSDHARILHPWFDGAADDSPARGDGHLPEPELAAACQVLSHHTSTPEDCYFALWDGYGDIYGGDSVAFLTAFAGAATWPGRLFKPAKPADPPLPAFPPAVLDGPRLSLGDRDFLLFTGALASAGDWGAAGYGHGIPRHLNSPNLMWPADHMWFLATDIYGSWSGVAGSPSLIDDLLADPRLEVVRTRRDDHGSRR